MKNQEYVYKVIYKYLRRNNYSFSESKIKLLLNSHPEFPSLKSITDTLDGLNVENLVAHLPLNSIDKLPKEFIAILKNGELCLVNKRVKKIKFITQSLKKEEKTISEFQNVWVGRVLAVERSNSSVTYNSILKYLGLFFLLFILFYHSNFTTIIMPLFSLIGLILSILILRKEIGMVDSISNKICINGEKVNCESVINYKEGIVLSKISFADLSFIFFSSITLIRFFLDFDFFFFFVLFLLCIPILFYSIFLQALIIRQWCLLCLSISCVILFMNTELLFGDFNLAFNSLFWNQSLSIFALVFMAWIYAKPKLLRYVDLVEIEGDNLKLKRNFRLFNTLLVQNKKLETSSIRKLSLGSNDPKAIVDIVISPTCSFCKQTFDVYKEIFEKNEYKDKIQVNFIFNSKIHIKDDDGRSISAQILNLYQEHGRKEAFNAMKFWFDNKDYQKWKEKYNSIDNANSKTLIENTKWCELNNIYHTPQVIINGYLYPSEYDLTDIEYQIEHLIEVVPA